MNVRTLSELTTIHQGSCGKTVRHVDSIDDPGLASAVLELCIMLQGRTGLHNCIRVDELFIQVNGRPEVTSQSLDHFSACELLSQSILFLIFALPRLYLKQVSSTDIKSHSHRTDTHSPTWKVLEAFPLLEARFQAHDRELGLQVYFRRSDTTA